MNETSCLQKRDQNEDDGGDGEEEIFQWHIQNQQTRCSWKAPEVPLLRDAVRDEAGGDKEAKDSKHSNPVVREELSTAE